MSFHTSVHSYRAVLLASTLAVLPFNAAKAETVADGAGEAIVVVGSIESGAIEAIQQQRNADNTINVVSSDDVGRFPDPNIAEALQRVPGIGVERDQGEGRYINIRGGPADFSSVSVDGVALTASEPTMRAIDLDTIPSDVISTLEVSKTLLPSQDADSITGLVNITTRSAFDKKGVNFSGSAGVSHNDYGGNDVRASAFVSSTFADDKLGVVLSGSYSRTDRKPENVESVWAVIDTTPAGADVLGLTETLFKDYDTKRERIALTGALEFKPSDTSSYYVRGSYSRFEDDEYRNQLGIIWEDGSLQPGATNSSATFTGATITKQFRHRIRLNEIMTVTVGGENELGNAKIDYNLGSTKSDQSYPARNELLYRLTGAPALSYDNGTNPDEPAYSLFDAGSQQHLVLGSYKFRENAYRNNITKNDEFSTAFNVSFPLNESIELKAGGRYRNRNVNADEERRRDRASGSAPAGTIADYLSDNPSTNYSYDLGYKFDPTEATTHLLDAYANAPRRMPESITADYKADEKVLAGYVMARGEFGATDVVIGLRVENTRFDGSSPTYNVDTKAIGEASASKRYTNWFPNLTVRHQFSEKLVGRAAITRGINRPNFIDLVPLTVEESDGDTIRVSQGNPRLNPTIANNFDASLEYYIDQSGLISAGAFYKDLQDYRYNITRTGTYLDVMDALITQPENAPKGELYGFEVNWSQKLRFLPGFLSNFGIFANYTYTKAHVNLAAAYAGRDRLPLPGQSKHTWNASVYYETSDFSARLSYTKRSDYLSEINADDARFDIYWEGRGQLDFTTSYKLTPNVTLFGEAKNLTNTPGVRYYGSRERVLEFEKFGYSLFGGVKVNF